ncbi:alpha-L-fucosidase [Mangrovibacterium lignilyticum]|uniref:alpha-L-fucosidase n=1 Tax=Mangrovibacterium lignilyticum TaxID=2668052 RepID=UPI0013D583D3|nr:alpha-L-fucosidase [Mangrovibacterium lignilyticum]
MTSFYNRRDFIKKSALTAGAASVFIPVLSESRYDSKSTDLSPDKRAVQRLPMDQLKKWEELKYGMFIHFGMSTFSGEELGTGKDPASLYNPTELDVDQWVKVARDAGMKYVILTAKHVSGHCLWPSQYTDYHVGNSGNTTDVIQAFVVACQKYQLKAGFYYCSWDNHHLFGSATPSNVEWEDKFTTANYVQFQLNQIEELITNYGPFMEVWVDIPGMLSYQDRVRVYEKITNLNPETLIMMNGGAGPNHSIKTDYSWPTDLLSMERGLPASRDGYNARYTVKNYLGEEEEYYIPGEVCDTICYNWFWKGHKRVRSAAEVLGMRLIAEERGANFLLNVSPDQRGLIPQHQIDALNECERLYQLCRN